MSKAYKYIKIPYCVVENDFLTRGAVVFYGKLLLLEHQKGYVYASNSYLAEVLNVHPRTITRYISELLTHKHIEVNYQNSYRRRIYLIDNCD